MPSLEEQVRTVADGLTRRNLTIATAESTLGGYLGHLLNNVPGSSKYYIGSVVAYHTKPKIELLKVPQAVFEESGSVSAQCALAMAHGVLEVMHTDIAVAETGMAGPGGGSTPTKKPVGTVFMAIATKDGYELAERSVWGTDRQGFKDKTAQALLSLVQHYLERKPSP